jgi:hypothetical protein
LAAGAPSDLRNPLVFPNLASLFRSNASVKGTFVQSKLLKATAK